ncbi:hypothetical protein [Exiguobacterium sp.]|uniref:hypothetical protein n=1 Tax=Exiguobacterium sp. TaxID=44751 RepID=UPI00263B93C4|nr:hypothetical protein [Exiguobacterium sp.]MCC5891477.1 hypothetical protein [Exiguobacterium sp.]
MNVLKLISWELDRVKKSYLILVGILLLLQFGWLGAFLWRQTATYEQMRLEGMTGYTVSFLHYLGSTVFTLSVGVAIVAMIFFSVWIWYRDFQGRGTFMMRLLTIPTGRMELFVAKFVTVMMLILGLFAIQWMALLLQYQLFTAWLNAKMIPLQGSFEMAIQFDYLAIMYPESGFNFLVHQVLIGFVVLALFTFVLVERGLWQRTLWSPLLAICVVSGLLALPTFLIIYFDRYLFMDEQIGLFGLALIGMVFGLTLLSRRFLSKKMSV